MKREAKLGMNLTGIQTSPIDSKAMIEFAERIAPDVPGNMDMLNNMRQTFVREAEPIGSVPLPGTVRGTINSLVEKIKGQPIEIFIDKLGERIAFERTGVRVYEALIPKAVALEVGRNIIQILEQFHHEEAEHLSIVVDALDSLGGDPTALTPAADVAAVGSSGVLKVIADPRTNFIQSLDALLIAELTDHAAWELLIDLAASLKKSNLVTSFEKALIQEQNHLTVVKKLLSDQLLTLKT